MASVALISIACSCGLLFAIWRRADASPLLAMAIAYAYMAFGPLIGSSLGVDLYTGVLAWNIPAACLTFVLALSGLTAAAFLTPTNRPLSVKPSVRPSQVVLIGVLLLGIAASAAMLIASVGHLGGENKTERIFTVGSTSHYWYLAVYPWLLALAYDAVHRGRHAVLAYAANASLYLIYCLVTLERDFVFVALALATHVPASRLSQTRAKQAAILAGAVVAVIILLKSIATDRRVWENGMLLGTLSEGSLLFVNTQVIDLIDSGTMGFAYGDTYLNTLLNLPIGLSLGGTTLTDWFKDTFAPGGASGYGFGLDAEAYLNGGYPAVFLVFFVIGWIQQSLHNRYRYAGKAAFLSVLFCANAMYALRNDSIVLVKPFLYGICFYTALIAATKILALRRHTELIGHGARPIGR